MLIKLINYVYNKIKNMKSLNDELKDSINVYILSPHTSINLDILQKGDYKPGEIHDRDSPTNLGLIEDSNHLLISNLRDVFSKHFDSDDFIGMRISRVSNRSYEINILSKYEVGHFKCKVKTYKVYGAINVIYLLVNLSIHKDLSFNNELKWFTKE